MRSKLRCGLLSVILVVMIQGQMVSAQEKKARPARPAKAKQAAQNKALIQGAGPLNRVLNQVKTLDLTPDQSKAIRELVQKSGPRAQAAQEAVQAARKGLDQAVIQGANEQTIRPAAQKMTEALVNQAVFQARIIGAVQSQLTEKQLATLKAGRKTGPQAVSAKAKPKAQKARDPQKVRARAGKNK